MNEHIIKEHVRVLMNELIKFLMNDGEYMKVLMTEQIKDLTNMPSTNEQVKSYATRMSPSAIERVSQTSNEWTSQSSLKEQVLMNWKVKRTSFNELKN